MTAATITLTDFLLARISDIEEQVRREQGRRDVVLMGAFNPARILAECAAKRAIVERCGGIVSVSGWEYDDAPILADAILRALASVYADHESFDPRWAG